MDPLTIASIALPILGGLFGGRSGSQPQSSGTSFEQTQTLPPDFAAPHLTNAAQYSQDAMFAGGPEQYPGRTVAPFSPQTEQALGMIEGLTTGPNPLLNAGLQNATSVLSGDFLRPETNPFLQSTFNRAADLTRNRLSSEFARAGRDIDASAPARSEELQTLASNIFGNNYQRERTNQLQTLGQLPSLMGARFIDPKALAGVGGTVEAQGQRLIDDAVRRFDFEQMRPELALDSFVNRLTSLASPYPSTSGTSSGSVPGVGAVPGAVGGLMFGNMLGNALGSIFNKGPNLSTGYDPGGLFTGSPGGFWGGGTQQSWDSLRF